MRRKRESQPPHFSGNDRMQPKKTYIRRTRTSRKTSRSVWVAETIARYLISAGGIGTIVAVIMVFLFLLYVAAPLFYSASLGEQHHAEIDWSKTAPLQMGMDEDQLMCWALFPNGSLQLVRLENGELLDKRDLFGKTRLSAVSFTSGGENTAFGFEDGSVRMGTIGFATSFIDPDELPEDIRNLGEGKSARWKTGVLVKTPQGQYRLQELSVKIDDPAEARNPSPVLLIDQSKTTDGQAVVVLTADGKLRLNS